MALIRVQDKTPTVYTWESRDFQIFSRLFDCIFNGVKYDIDSMLNILDVSKCRANILQLLQTKLGFFTRRTIDDASLRCILQAFPLLVKSKGSLKAIKYAINVFLKAYGVTAEINVWYVNSSDVVYNTKVDDHTIIIGLNKALTNMYVLEELFRYILPTGFGFFMYFYNTVDDVQSFATQTNAKLLYASDNINSMLRGSSYTDSLDGDGQPLGDAFVNRTLGGVDVVEIASSDSPIQTTSGTYEPGDASKFLGILTQEPGVSGATDYAYIKLTQDGKYKLYYRYASNWYEIKYLGAVESQPENLSNGTSWTIINNGVSTHYIWFNGSAYSPNCLYDLYHVVEEE